MVPFHVTSLDLGIPFKCCKRTVSFLLGSLSKDVFEGRTSTGSEPFSLFICLDANKFVLLSFFSLIKRIYPRVSNKPLPNDAKGPLPVDVRRSTTLLLKLPNIRREGASPRKKVVQSSCQYDVYMNKSLNKGVFLSP